MNKIKLFFRELWFGESTPRPRSLYGRRLARWAKSKSFNSQLCR